MSYISNHKVYVQLPKTGLGNMMLVWGRGLAFAHEHNMELFISKWWGFRLGAWLRGENKKRVYWQYFKEDNLIQRVRLLYYRITWKVVAEPVEVDVKSQKKTLFVFKEVLTDGDYFKDLKPHRQKIKAALYDLLTPVLHKKLNAYSKPAIGIHVRRGDFKLGSSITPTSFFVDAIKAIRASAGKELPVTIFTDASNEEIKDILLLPSVKLAEPKPDVLDIILLSQSDICILSISSTFSMWAGFLSDEIVLKHPTEWHPPIRPTDINLIKYEGFFDKAKGVDDRFKEFMLQS